MLSQRIAFFLTISLGVSISASEDTNITSLLSRADLALYQAKKRGRNRVQVASVSEAA
ncbi:MAG: diguanylate cyclase [Beijerinckiaceae bacterium]|nr:diguanylate cyclase [Beijerinckiaceae bacterium]